MCGCAGFDGSNSNSQSVTQQPKMVEKSTRSVVTDMNTTKLLAGLAVGALFFLAYKKFYS